MCRANFYSEFARLTGLNDHSPDHTDHRPDHTDHRPDYTDRNSDHNDHRPSIEPMERKYQPYHHDNANTYFRKSYLVGLDEYNFQCNNY
ncbi:hypothetical protein CLCR_06479 [Cladophialophora carrionii]|uniref:Uncharacterized protein n=1 Tax=Cladophialophora carrionii TaxID=86049 RepID=A0A1C1C7H5_9EURO|nr:hypothetical protein CLCR_06479 [Cladophialophora carrionii]